MSPSDPRLAARTLELCAIPSVTGDEAACADFVEAALRARPWAVERVGHTVLARTRGEDDRPLVLLVGHTDTVPARDGTPAPRVDGDRLYGLGASDMKGGLAVMLALADALDPDALPYRLGLVFYDREEGPWAESGLGPALDAAPWLRTAALAFCLEPSDNVVQVGCLGSLHVKVVFSGRAAHSARPWQGHNAIHDAGPLLLALAGRAPRDHLCDGHLFREVLSATLASGGRTRNVIPDHFELNLNLRFAPGRTVEDAADEVRRFVADALGAEAHGDHLIRADGLSATLVWTERAPSGPVVTHNPLLRAFLAQNGNPVTAKQAWTDVARLGAAGIDAVNLGPGVAAQAHQAGEWCLLSLLDTSYAQFHHFLTGRG